ncbi:hypothetical protein OAV62_01255 [bacterium]|nr:hypothetical protein [bacterium]
MIQYPKNTHLTLSSPEGAFSTLNILRDPPKSIHTRYIEKVGDTNKITREIDASGDRFCEAIMPFARGVNPMVDVSYSNYGTNGGQNRYIGGSYDANSTNHMSGSLGQVKLPYRVMREGAFRPPIKPPQELLPLSRLPRLSTSRTCNPSSQQFLKRIECRPDKKVIRDQLLNICAPSRRTFNIELPHEKPYNIKYSIQNTPQGCAQTNVGSSLGNGQLSERRTPIAEIQNRTYGSVTSNAFKNIAQPLDLTTKGTQPIPVKDTIKGSYSTNVTLKGEGTIRGKHRVLDRNIPHGFIRTNATITGDITNQQLARKYTYLPERKSLGGFCNGGVQKKFDTVQNRTVNLSQANQVKNTAYRLSQNRYAVA